MRGREKNIYESRNPREWTCLVITAETFSAFVPSAILMRGAASDQRQPRLWGHRGALPLPYLPLADRTIFELRV